jgi:hypothetical protein
MMVVLTLGAKWGRARRRRRIVAARGLDARDVPTGRRELDVGLVDVARSASCEFFVGGFHQGRILRILDELL